MLLLVAATASEYLPCRHCIQAELPFLSLYLPAGHASQSVALRPVNPGLHLQALSASLEAGDDVFLGHLKQAVIDGLE